MTNISVVSKQNHQVLENVNSNQVGLSENSVVIVQVSKEDVASITRDNNNALINLRNGEVIVIENYFNPEFSDNSLVFEEQDGLLYWVKFTNVDGTIADTIQYYPIDEIEPLLYSDNFLGGILPWLIGAGAAGAIAAAAKDDDKDPVPDNKPATLTVPTLEDDVDPIKGPIKNGDSTNDAKPTISGSGATPGATIKVYDGDKVIAETVADSEGKWSVTPTENLADGPHNVSVTQTVDGKESNKSPVVDFKVDTVPPQKPSIDDFTNDKGETNSDKPTIKGDGEPNSKVIIDIKDKDGNVIDSKTVPVDDKGKWEYKPDNKLDDGKHDVIVTPVDDAGNKGESNTKPFIVDTTPPFLSIDKPTDTDDSTPTITGKTEAGAKVTVQIVDENGNVKASGPATVDANGNWTFTPADALPEGKYKVKAEAEDSAGNKANAETEGLFTVDGGDLSIRVNDVPDGKEAAPEITGSVKAGATVTVYIISKNDGEVYESGTATVNGTSWTFKPSKALVDGDYEVYAEAKHLTTTEKSNTDSFVVDTTGPAISIDEPANTDDQTPTITGTTDKDDAVVVKVRILDSTGKVVASGDADLAADGKWSFTPATELPDGKYTVEADALDKYDNKGTAKSNGDFVIDTVDPSKLVSVDPLGKTNDNTPDITGETAVGSTVKVIILKNGVEVATGDAVVTGGTWKYTPTTALADDSYEVKAIATYNNKIGTSNSVPLIVDTTPPNLDIDDPDDNENPDPFGTNNTLRTLLEPENTLMADTLPPIYVKDPRFTFTGNRDDSETVKIIISRIEDGEEVEIFNKFATIKGEKWEYRPPIDLPEGTFKITVLGNDDVNNVGSYSRDLIVDLTPPPIEVEAIPLTKDNTPTFTGKTEAGLKSFQLQLRDANGKPVETITKVAVDANGNWTYTPSKELADGKYTLELVADDLAGNRTRKPTEITIDTIAPQIEIDEPQNTADTTPTITGRTEVGATVKVQILDKDGKVVAEGPATVEANGNWSFTPATPLADGTYKVYAEATDAAGNVGNDTSANSFEINDKAPEVSINEIADTNDTTPEISGKTDAGSTVVVTITDKDGKVVASGPATVTGDTWSYTASPALAKDGDYTVQAEATSPTGVKGQAEPKDFTLDTTPPVITIEEPQDTSDNTPEIKGKTEPGATVNVQILDKDGKVVAEGPATVDPNGNWTYTPDKELPNGEYKVKAEAKDPVGNVGKAETAGSFDIDNTDPSKFVTVDPIADTNDTTPDITGKTLEGSTVTVTVKDSDGKVVATGPATVTGDTWTYTVSPALAKDGDYTVQAEATSRTGVKGNSNEETFELDTTPPVITIEEPQDTSDNTPEIKGKTEPGATVNVQILDKDGKVVAEGPATVDSNGNWTYTPDQELPNGEYTVKAEAKDPVGNVGEAETAGSFDIDNTDPSKFVTVDPIEDTNDTTPDITGKTLEGSTVTVTVKDSDGKVVATGPATVTGDTWTYTVSPALAKDGDYTVQAEATSRTGVKGNSNEETFELDTTPPVITIEEPQDTSDNTPEIKGKTEPGATVNVQILDKDGKVVAEGPATVDSNGNWTYTPDQELPNGEYTVKAEAKDPVGNVGEAETAGSFDIDNTDPSKFVTVDPIEDTNDTTPDITGKTLEGSTVTVTVKDSDGKVVATGPATVTGDTWTYTVSPALAKDGDYTVQAEATSRTGVKGNSNEETFELDTTPPVITINEPTDTEDTTPDITGKTEPGATVNVQILDKDGKVIAEGPATVDPNGNWTYTPDQELPEGEYKVKAEAKDPVGNKGQAESQGSFNVDTKDPADYLTINEIPDGNDTTPDVAGKTLEGSTVQIKIKDATGKVVQQGAAEVTGDTWTYTVSPALAQDGDYTVEATASYKNKNGVKTEDFLLDTTPPVVEIDTLAKTRDTTPDITGTSEAGAKVIVQVMTPQYEVLATGEVTTDANGKWTFTPATPLPEGTLWVVAQASDQFGNAADAIPKSFIIDLTPPSPTIDDPEDDNDDPFNTTIDGGEELVLFAAGIEEPVVSAFATTTTLGAKTLLNEPVVTAAAVKPIYFKSQTFKVNGTTDNDTVKSDVTITNAAGVVVASGPATLVPHPSKPGYLRWEFTVSSPLPEGTYNLSVTSTDATGLTGTTSNPIVIDITPPVLTIDAEDLTNSKTPVINGTSEPNGTVTLQIKDANGTVVIPAVTVPVDANGKWSYTPSTPLADGKYTIDGVAKDAAGHTTTAQDSITIDTTPPAAPTGQLSNNNTVINGEAEPGSKVTFTVDGKVVGETTADANGKYTYTFNNPVTSPAGVVINATDAAGNISLPGYAKITDVVLDAKDDFNTIVHADEASSAIIYRNGATSKLDVSLAKASIFKLDQDTNTKGNSDTNNSGADAAILKYQGDDLVFKVADNTSADITFEIGGWTGIGLTGVGDTLNVVGEALNFILNAPKNLFNFLTGKQTTTTAPETGNIYALLVNAGTDEIVDKVLIGKNVPLVITSIQTGSGTFKNIPPGEYEVKIVKGSSQGFIEQILKVANLDILPITSLKVKDAVVHDLNAPNTISGNVITGESAKDAADGTGDLSKLRVGQVKSESVAQSKQVVKYVGTDINKDFVEVEGEYGYLVLKADGSYEYRLKEGVGKDAVGKVDVFSYKVLNGSKDADAKLTIKIDDKNLTASKLEHIPDDPNIQAIKDYNLIESQPAVIHDNLNNTSGNFGFAGSAKILDNLQIGNGKGTLAELNIITPDDPLQFEVKDGYVQDLTLNITGGGLSVSSVLSSVTQILGFQSKVQLDVYDKLTGEITNIGSYEARFERGVDNVLIYRVNGDLPIEVKGLKEGSYEIIPTVVPADPLSQAISVLAKLEFFKNLKLTVTDSVAYELPEVKGNVIEGGEYYNGEFLGKDDIHSKVIVDKVQVYGEPSGAVSLAGNFATIQGKYGELTIYNNGNYSYRLTDLNADGTRVETFTYTIKNAYGKSSSAELEIKVNVDGTTYVSTSAVDQVGSNSDQSTTLLYKVLDAASNTGGNADNGPDVFLGFKQGHDNNTQTEARDFIDISSLISGHGATGATLSNFVSVRTEGKDTIISVDRDGKQGFNSATFQEQDLVVLKDVNTTLDELLKSNQIIF